MSSHAQILQAIDTAAERIIEASRQIHDNPELRFSVRLALEGNQAYYEPLGYTFLSYGTHAGYTTPNFVTLCKRLGLECQRRSYA